MILHSFGVIYHVDIDKERRMMIGEKIKVIRKKHNLTQRALGQAISYSPTYISDIERGQTQPSIDILRKISQYLEIDIIYFFSNET